jgi:hypothetical protein
MEGWRQRRLGSREPFGKRRNKEEERKKEKREKTLDTHRPSHGRT